MRKITRRLTVSILVVALIITSAASIFAADSEVKTFSDTPEIGGTSAILIDGATGEILYEKNAYEQRDPASITKVLNALVVLDNLNMSDKVSVSGGLETLGHVLDLQQGEILSVKDLMYGMLVYSGNDAAEALAIATAGSIDNFCAMMNQKAVECGAKNTNFTNANGMNNPGQENHKTTAYDLAMISKEAMKNKTFRKIVSTTSYTIEATNKSDARTFKTTNACLSKKPLKMDGYTLDYTYKGCTGIKTGETSTAGECIICSAKRGNTELIAVVLNAPTKAGKFEDATNLLNYGFKHYKTYTAQKADEYSSEIKVKHGSLSKVQLGLEEDFNITVDKEFKAASEVTVEEKLEANKVEAPVKKGTIMGTLVAKDGDGNVLATASLVALESAKVGGPLSKIGIADEHVPLFIIIVSLVVLLLLIFLVLLRIRAVNKRKQRARRRKQMQQQGRIPQQRQVTESNTGTRSARDKKIARKRRRRNRKRRNTDV